MSPTDEIGLLLGVAATGGPAVAGDRKPLGPDRVATDRKDDGKAVSAVHDRPVSATHAEPPIALVDLPRRSRTHDDDARSSGGDAVRVVGGNGSRRATDIALSRSPEAAKDSDKPASANRVDTAVVLEARRYLGFSPDSNATTLASAARSDPTWNAALDASRLTGLGALADTMREVNTLKLQMNPENLGHMVASLKLRGEELSVEVRVDSIEAYRHLSADHDDLVKALQDQGFSIDKVTVQLNAADRTDTSADRDMARQGQTQREGQEGQSNRNDGRQGGQRQKWESARQMADAARGNGGADADRAGNIYL